MNDRGIAAVAYNVALRPGVTLGLGASFDTQKINEGTHKVCTNLRNEASCAIAYSSTGRCKLYLRGIESDPEVRSWYEGGSVNILRR